MFPRKKKERMITKKGTLIHYLQLYYQLVIISVIQEFRLINIF